MVRLEPQTVDLERWPALASPTGTGPAGVVAEALRRVVKSFPDEGVLLDAGWDGCEVDEACEAYDSARAALDQEKGRG